MTYTGRLRQKGVPFQASGGRDFKGREICHFGREKDLKGLTDTFYDCGKGSGLGISFTF